MYAMSLASGLFLLDKPAASVAVSAIGVILGWPFSILAFLPVTLYSLYKKFKQAFIAGAVTSVILLVSQISLSWFFFLPFDEQIFSLLLTLLYMMYSIACILLGLLNFIFFPMISF